MCLIAHTPSPKSHIYWLLPLVFGSPQSFLKDCYLGENPQIGASLVV